MNHQKELKGFASSEPTDSCDFVSIKLEEYRLPPKRNLAVTLCRYFLFAAFGLSAWIVVNCLFMELPVYVKVLPEGYAIASYISMSIQLANIWPLLFVSAWNYRGKVPLPYVVIIPFLLAIGITIFIVLALYWRTTHTVFGKERSVFIILMGFIGGAVDCTSSVVYWPFISNFPPEAVSALAFGESLSGAVASIIGALQNPAHPRFSVRTYYFICAAVMVVCACAFAIIMLLFSETSTGAYVAGGKGWVCDFDDDGSEEDDEYGYASSSEGGGSEMSPLLSPTLSTCSDGYKLPPWPC
jgi:hypothetical protein